MADNFNVTTNGGVATTIAAKDITGGGVYAAKHVIVDTSGNTMPAGDTVAHGINVVVGDTTNAITVKAASTLAATTDTGLVVRPLAASDGTHTMPIGDAAAREIFVGLADGTNGPAAIKAASTGAAATDKALVVRPMTSTDGTNTAPTMDAIARAGFQEITDGTTGPVFVTPASTAAVAGNKALVVAVHPTSPVTTNADGIAAGGTLATKCLLAGAQFLAYGSLPALTTGQGASLQSDAPGNLKVAVAPMGTPIYGTANGAAQANNVTLTIPAAKMGYLDGFDIDGLGATLGSAIAVTVAGILGGTLTFQVGIPAGITAGASISKRFNPPLQASAVNTNIVVSVPSFGSGNTAASTNAYGHYV